MAESERRVFLRVLGAAAASWACGACASESTGGGGGGAGGSGGSPTTSVSSTAASGGDDAGMCTGPGVLVGDPAAFTTLGLHFAPGTRVLVGRDAGGLYALSSICTHRGCDMNGDGQLFSTGVECRCHGSVFGLDGHVVRGPAFGALASFAMSVVCGQLWVDTSQVVASTQRLVV